MPSVAPAEESVVLLNELIDLNSDDHDALVRLCWRAKALLKALPADFAVRTIMASTLLQTGNRAEALEEMEAAYNLRSIDHIPVMSHLAHLHASVGDHTRCGKLFRQMTSQEGVRMDPIVNGNAGRFAVCAGDVAYLTELSELQSKEDYGYSQDALKILNENGLIDHLENHQKIVMDIIGDRQIWVGSVLVAEEGSPMIAIFRRIEGSAHDRQEMNRQMTRALCGYYQGQGLPPGEYRTGLVTMLSITHEMAKATEVA